MTYNDETNACIEMTPTLGGIKVGWIAALFVPNNLGSRLVFR